MRSPIEGGGAGGMVAVLAKLSQSFAKVRTYPRLDIGQRSENLPKPLILLARHSG